MIKGKNDRPTRGMPKPAHAVDWNRALQLAKKAEAKLAEIKDREDEDVEEVFYTVAAGLSSCGVGRFCKRIAGKLVCSK